MLAAKLLSSLSGAAEEKLYVDDVFSAYTYTGNGETLSINNGIDLAGKGGLVWVKARSGSFATRDHVVVDTVRGSANELVTNMTYGSNNYSSFSAFTSSGFTLGPSQYSGGGTTEYASWSFRKAPKFFDVVTYTGNGVSGRQIPHALGAVPGMVIVKCTDQTGLWTVLHVSLGGTKALFLDQTNGPITNGSMWNNTDPTSSVFTVGNAIETNADGYTFVAYLFANDPAADGMIQCGGYTGNNSNNGPTITLGWEPQYLMVKSTGTSNWTIVDSMRGFTTDGNDKVLWANGADSEMSSALVAPTATGFKITSLSGAVNDSAVSYIYMAIRRPNKPPTVGTQVYKGLLHTGTNITNTIKTGVGFAPDLLISRCRLGGYEPVFYDRLRGVKALTSNNTSAESAYVDGVLSFQTDGVTFGVDSGIAGVNYLITYVEYFFKRAPGVFDIVCYTGTGVAHTEAHGLGVAPELIILKNRGQVSDWAVYSAAVGNTKHFALQDGSTLYTDLTVWNNTSPTPSVFSVGTSPKVNGSPYGHVAYLFATLTGISKVGSYTGDGTSGKVINCGFSTGARFVLIKRTDANGSWIMWDTARGIVAGPDPHLTLNTIGAEVTTADSIDPDVSGFIVNQLAGITDINVSGATYIFLAFA